MKHTLPLPNSIVIRLLFLLLSCFSALTIYAQSNTKKIEIQLKDKDIEDHKITPLNDGLLVSYIRKPKTFKGMKEIIADKYDLDLVKQKTTKFQIRKEFEFVNYAIDSDCIYFLYANARGIPAMSARYSAGLTEYYDPVCFFKQYTIVKFNPNTAEVQTYSGKYDRNFGVTAFHVKKGIVYLGGSAGKTFWGNAKYYIILAPIWWVPAIFYKQPFKPCIISVDMNEQNPLPSDKYMKEYGKGYSTISSLDINEADNEFSMLVTSLRKRKTALSYKTIKNDVIGKEEKIKFPKEKMLTSVKTKTVGSTKLYAGIYRSKESFVTVNSMSKIGISEGLAIGMSSNSKNVFNTLISFNKFQNLPFVFKAHHNQKDVKRKEDADIIMSVLFHNIIQKEDKIIYTGEVYYPHVHYEEIMTFSSNGASHTQVVPVLDGYKRKGALIFAVDLKGKLLWDNAIEIIDGTISMELNEKIVFQEQEDGQIAVYYGDGATVKRALFNEGEKPVIINETVFASGKKAIKESKKPKMQPMLTALISEEFHESTLEYWYDNYFIEYGESVNKSKAQKKSMVFYVNKIAID